MAEVGRIQIEADARDVPKVTRALNDLGLKAQEVGRKVSGYQKETEQATRATDRMTRSSRKLRRMMLLLSSGIGGLTFTGLAREVGRATNELNNIEATMRVAAGSSEVAAKQLAFITEESERLGLFLPAVAKQMAQFSAAARGTAITGKDLESIFTGISEASRAMGLTAPQTEGAMLALQQMMSKGKVSAEELRQQLGERMPGSIQIMAQALNVGTRELFDMMENGELLSDEVLPKFGKELQKVFGTEAEKQANKLAASVDRVRTAFFNLMAQEDGLPGAASAFNDLAETISSDSFQRNFDILVQLVSGFMSVIGRNLDHIVQLSFLLGIAGVAKGVSMLIKGLSTLNGLFASLVKKKVATNTATIALIGSMNTFSAVLSRIAWPIGALTAFGTAVAVLTHNTKEAKEATRDWMDVLPNLGEDLTQFGRSALQEIAEDAKEDLSELESLREQMQELRQEIRDPSASGRMAGPAVQSGLREQLDNLEEIADTYIGVEEVVKRAERALLAYRMQTLENNATDKVSIENLEQRAEAIRALGEFDEEIADSLELADAAEKVGDAFSKIFPDDLEARNEAIQDFMEKYVLVSEEASDNTKSLAEKQNDLLDILAKYDEGTAKAVEYGEAVQDLSNLVNAGTISQERMNEILKEQADIIFGGSDSVVFSYEKLRAAVDPAFDSAIRYRDTIHELKEALEEGNITTEQYVELVGKAADSMIDFGNESQKSSNKVSNAAEDIERDLNAVADRVEREFSDTFYNIFDDGLDSFNDLADGIFDIFKRTLADMAAAAIRNQIVIPISQQIVGAPSVAGGALSTVGNFALGAGSSAGGGMGIGSIASTVGRSILSPGAGIGKAFATSGIGKSLGLSATLQGGAGALGGQVAGTSGLGLTSAGSAFAGLASVALPIAGLAILGGLFGSDPADTAAINRVAGGERLKFRTGISGGDKISDEQARELTIALNPALQEYADSLNEAITNTVGTSLSESLDPERLGLKREPGSDEFFRVDKINKIVEDYFDDEGAGIEGATSAILGKIVEGISEQITGPVGEAISKLDVDAEEFGQRFFSITSIFSNATGDIVKELSRFVEETSLKGQDFVDVLGSFNEALRTLDIRGQLDIVDEISGRSGRASATIEFVEVSNAIEELIGVAGGQQTIIDRAKRSLKIFSDSVGLVGDNTITTASEFENYIRSLDLTKQSGRDAAKSALEYSDAFNVLSDAFQEEQRVAEEIAQEREGLERRLLELQGDTEAIRQLEIDDLDESNRSLQKRIFALQDQQDYERRLAQVQSERAQIQQDYERRLDDIRRERLETQASLENELLESFGRSAALVRRELAGMTSENAALQIAVNLRQNLAGAQERLNSAESELASAIENRADAIERAEEQRASAIEEAENQLLSVIERELQNRVSAVEEAEQKISEAEEALNSARIREQEDIVSSLLDQVSDLESTAQQAEELANAWQDSSKSLAGAADELFGISGRGAQNLEQQFRETLQSALRGDQESFQDLPEIATSLAEERRSVAGSLAQARRIDAAIARQLKTASVFASEQALEQKSEVELAKDQVDSLEKQISQAEKQIESLQGTELTVKQAEEQLRKAREFDIESHKEHISKLENQAESLKQQEMSLDQARKAVEDARNATLDQFANIEEMNDRVNKLRENVDVAKDTLKSAQDASTQAIDKIGELLPDSIVNGLMEPLSPLEQIDASTKAMVNLLNNLEKGEVVDDSGTVTKPDKPPEKPDMPSLPKPPKEEEKDPEPTKNFSKIVKDIFDEELARGPSESEVEKYVGKLESGMSESFLNSLIGALPEAKVVDAFRDVLGREPLVQSARDFYEDFINPDTGSGIGKIKEDLRASPEFEIIQAFEDILGRSPSIADRRFYEEKLESGTSIDKIRDELAASPEAQGFARGGIASGPMSGYPATLHGTEAVIPLNGQRIPLEVNNQDMIQELRDLKTEVKQLRSEQEQSQYELVKFTKRNNRQFEQWDIDGLPETRTA